MGVLVEPAVLPATEGAFAGALLVAGFAAAAGFLTAEPACDPAGAFEDVEAGALAALDAGDFAALAGAFAGVLLGVAAGLEGVFFAAPEAAAAGFFGVSLSTIEILFIPSVFNGQYLFFSSSSAPVAKGSIVYCNFITPETPRSTSAYARHCTSSRTEATASAVQVHDWTGIKLAYLGDLRFASSDLRASTFRASSSWVGRTTECTRDETCGYFIPAPSPPDGGLDMQ